MKRIERRAKRLVAASLVVAILAIAVAEVVVVDLADQRAYATSAYLDVGRDGRWSGGLDPVRAVAVMMVAAEPGDFLRIENRWSAQTGIRVFVVEDNGANAMDATPAGLILGGRTPPHLIATGSAGDDLDVRIGDAPPDVPPSRTANMAGDERLVHVVWLGLGEDARDVHTFYRGNMEDVAFRPEDNPVRVIDRTLFAAQPYLFGLELVLGAAALGSLAWPARRSAVDATPEPENASIEAGLSILRAARGYLRDLRWVMRMGGVLLLGGLVGALTVVDDLAAGLVATSVAPSAWAARVVLTILGALLILSGGWVALYRSVTREVRRLDAALASLPAGL